MSETHSPFVAVILPHLTFSIGVTFHVTRTLADVNAGSVVKDGVVGTSASSRRAEHVLTSVAKRMPEVVVLTRDFRRTLHAVAPHTTSRAAVVGAIGVIRTADEL